MKSWAKWTARTVLVMTSLAVFGSGLAGVALASAGPIHAGNVSVLSGNKLNVPVSVPIDVCGNAAAILGIAWAGCQGGASVAPVAACGDPVWAASAQCHGGSGWRGRACPCGEGGRGALASAAKPVAAPQLAGLGALPVLADLVGLPAFGGLDGLPLMNGLAGTGVPMPLSALGPLGAGEVSR